MYYIKINIFFFIHVTASTAKVIIFIVNLYTYQLTLKLK